MNTFSKNTDLYSPGFWKKLVLLNEGTTLFSDEVVFFVGHRAIHLLRVCNSTRTATYMYVYNTCTLIVVCMHAKRLQNKTCDNCLQPYQLNVLSKLIYNILYSEYLHFWGLSGETNSWDSSLNISWAPYMKKRQFENTCTCLPTECTVMYIKGYFNLHVHYHLCFLV